MNFRLCLVFALAVLWMGNAEAGTVTNGVWAATGCGAEPTPPAIDTTGESAFSKSLDAQEAYEKKGKEYPDCFFKEAAADNVIINNSAKAEQDRYTANVAQLDKDADAGMDKFGGSKKKK